MKKVLNISIAVILLASGMQVSIDRHYCGGSLADVKISMTGKMASCGMEQTEPVRLSYTAISKKCCEDQVTFLSINSKYLPENFIISHLTSSKSILFAPVNNYISGDSFNSILVSWVLPPGDNHRSGLTQPEICVFRI